MDKRELNRLLIKLQQNDDNALDGIYELTKKSVFSIALSVVKNYAEAEDLMQNTYIRVREKINNYTPNTNGYSWILTIAKNLSINESKKRGRETVIDFNENDFINANENTSNDIPIFKIAKAVLNEEELSIVLLHCVSGYKHREIAEITEKPLGTVLWKYKNALQKLKNKLGGNGYEG